MSAIAQAFALLGGAVSYAAHLLLGSALVPWACGTGSVLPIHLATVAALGAVAASAAAGWRILARHAGPAERERAGSGPAEHGAAGGAASAVWMARTGVLLNGLFALIILFGELPTWFLDPCLP